MERNYKQSANQGGTYKITNSINGKIYYGSTVRFRTRCDQHQKDLEKNKHGNKHLQAAWNKDGSDAFVFEVIELITGLKQDRLNAEQLLLDKYWDGCVNCYNIEKTAWSREGRKSKNPSPNKGRKHTEETKKKISVFHKGKTWRKGIKLSEKHREAISKANKGKTKSSEIRQRMSKAQAGRIVTNETKQKISLSRKGKLTGQNHYMFGLKHTEESKKKMSIAKLGKSHTEEWKQKIRKTYYVISPTNEKITISNVKEFCELNQLYLPCFRRMLFGKRPSHKGWKVDLVNISR